MSLHVAGTLPVLPRLIAREPVRGILLPGPACLKRLAGFLGWPPSSLICDLLIFRNLPIQQYNVVSRGKAAERGADWQVARERGGRPCIQGIPLQCLCRPMHAQAGRALPHIVLHGIISSQKNTCVMASSASKSWTGFSCTVVHASGMLELQTGCCFMTQKSLHGCRAQVS